MDKVKIFEYEGTPVEFSTDNESFVMVMPRRWLRSSEKGLRIG